MAEGMTPERVAELFKHRLELAEAARELLAKGGASYNVHQAESIILRDADPNEENPRLLHLIPLGSVVGIAITPFNTLPQDKDIIFVAASALGNALPAMGFTVAYQPMTQSYIMPPKDAPR